MYSAAHNTPWREQQQQQLDLFHIIPAPVQCDRGGPCHIVEVSAATLACLTCGATCKKAAS